jgi:hypothetical protein
MMIGKNMKKLLLLLALVFILTGCDVLDEGVCINAKNLTYDGISGNGDFIIKSCNTDSVLEEIQINNSSMIGVEIING